MLRPRRDDGAQGAEAQARRAPIKRDTKDPTELGPEAAAKLADDLAALSDDGAESAARVKPDRKFRRATGLRLREVVEDAVERSSDPS